MKICVYTVLLGGYDALLDQPVAVDSRADFICFTDDPDLVSETWQTHLVEPYLPQDLHRSSRVYKILGHDVLQQYDVTICIDASVLLRRTPEQIVDEWLTPQVDMAFARHSFREQVLDEFDEVVRLNYDDRSRVYEQLTDYAMAYPDVLEASPQWGGLIVRRNTPEVARAMRLWYDHVLRYSRRDQLSLMVALLHGGATWRSLEVDNFDSEYQQWPVVTDRKVGLGKAPALPSGPLIAEVRRSRNRIAELEEQIGRFDHAALHDLHTTIAQLRQEIEQGVNERVRLESQLTATQRALWDAERRSGQPGSLRHAARQLRLAAVATVRGLRKRE